MADRQYIKGYFGDVNAGDQSGTVISESNPLFTTVNISTGEEVCVDFAIRSDNGYASYENTTIAIEGLNKKYWALEYNGVKGGWGEPIVIEDQISNVNTIIKAYAKAGADEEPSEDTTVSLRITGLIQSV